MSETSSKEFRKLRTFMRMHKASSGMHMYRVPQLGWKKPLSSSILKHFGMWLQIRWPLVLGGKAF